MRNDGDRFSAHRDRAGDQAGRTPENHPLLPINRRRFLAYASAGFLGATVRAPRTLAGGFSPIDIGTLKDFPADAISEKFIEHNFFVIRHKGRLYASTAICPHKGNYLLRDPQDPNRIICSGHDSVFSPEGRRIAGKTTRGLTRFGIALNDQGRLLVDPDQQFSPQQWNEKRSYVAVK
jgi:nitrite reductase/ring-hydroxylating ferredoxin subunit